MDDETVDDLVVWKVVAAVVVLVLPMVVWMVASTAPTMAVNSARKMVNLLETSNSVHNLQAETDC